MGDWEMSMELGHMVTLRDIGALRVPGADFVELLLFNGDSEIIDVGAAEIQMSRTPSIKFVHAQEFVGPKGEETLLDLSSEDEGLRRRSIDAVESARAVARAIPGSKVVIHPGGIRDGPVDKRVLRSNLARSLQDLGRELLLLENMPWYYWQKGTGQRVANLCVGYHDMIRFSDLVEGFTLDTSHGYLSRPDGDKRFCEDFMSVLGGQTFHVHASDAKAPDREGLQIGDGEVDFSFLAGVDVPVLVEVWNGHENDGDGFRIGIEKLRSLETLQR